MCRLNINGNKYTANLPLGQKKLTVKKLLIQWHLEKGRGGGGGVWRISVHHIVLLSSQSVLSELNAGVGSSADHSHAPHHRVGAGAHRRLAGCEREPRAAVDNGAGGAHRRAGKAEGGARHRANQIEPVVGDGGDTGDAGADDVAGKVDNTAGHAGDKPRCAGEKVWLLLGLPGDGGGPDAGQVLNGTSAAVDGVDGEVAGGANGLRHQLDAAHRRVGDKVDGGGDGVDDGAAGVEDGLARAADKVERGEEDGLRAALLGAGQPLHHAAQRQPRHRRCHATLLKKQHDLALAIHGKKVSGERIANLG